MEDKIGTIIVLTILLVLALGYIFGSKLVDSHDAKVVLRAQNTVNSEYYTTAETCQSIPLTKGNQTINLIAIECPVIQACLQGQ